MSSQLTPSEANILPCSIRHLIRLTPYPLPYFGSILKENTAFNTAVTVSVAVFLDVGGESTFQLAKIEKQLGKKLDFAKIQLFC